MKGIDLWKKYCSFYEKDFSEHVEYSKTRMKRYFEKWRRTDFAKILCQKRPRDFREVPLTRYDDYPMLKEFGQKVLEASKKTPRKPGELFKEYYDRIGRKFGLALNSYMTEPF